MDEPESAARIFAPFIKDHPEHKYLEQLILDLCSGKIDARIKRISDAIRDAGALPAPSTLSDDVAGFL